MIKKLILNGQKTDLILEAGEFDSWIKCYLETGRSRIFLGAERKSYLTNQLVNYFENPNSEINGSLDDFPVSWVSSLAENHHVLYIAKGESDYLLFWQNARRENFGIVSVERLEKSQVNAWLQKLNDFCSDED